MKRFLLLMMTGFIAVSGIKAQVTASKGMVEYQKGQIKRSSVIELPYPPETLEKVIRDRMAQKGIKGEEIKDVLIFRNVKLDNDSELSDLHFKIERKSKKEKNISLVHVVVARSSENVSTRAATEEYKVDKGHNVLNDLVPATAAYTLEQSIKEQDDIIKKAEKKLNNLLEDQERFETRLAQNKLDQDALNLELEKQKAVRTEMLSRRGAGTGSPASAAPASGGGSAH